MRRVSHYLLQDWSTNRARPHLAVLLVLFRAAQAARRGPVRRRTLAIPLAAIYRALAVSAFGIDMPVSTQVGQRLCIHHGFGLVVHSGSRLGEDVVLRHGVTIGARTDRPGAPTVGDRVEFGPNSIALGPISIGDDATIGAGAVVTRDVVAGGSARAPRALYAPPEFAHDGRR